MLCDQIHQYADQIVDAWNTSFTKSSTTVEEIRKLMEGCQRFFLTSDFAKIEWDSKKVDYFQKILPLVRLPYNLVWIEYRQHGIEWGYLLCETPEGGLQAKMFRLLPNDKKKMHIDIMGFTIYPKLYEIDVKLDYANLPYSVELIKDSTVDKEKLKTTVLVQGYRLMDIIARLNSRNITDVTTNNLEKLNKSRAKKNKTALLSYRTVDLSRDVKRAISSLKQGEGEADSAKRMHWVRGHFKVRKTGIFWWNPHLAGIADEGFIEKDYVA